MCRNEETVQGKLNSSQGVLFVEERVDPTVGILLEMVLGIKRGREGREVCFFFFL